MKNYDLIILGGGSASFSAALKAAEFGAKVLMIEENLIGGTCVNRGCIPSKFLLYVSELMTSNSIENVKGIEIKAKYDLEKLMLQKKSIVEKLRREKYEKLLKFYKNIKYVSGKGKFVEEGIKVKDKVYIADKYIIATGSSPYIPNIKLNGLKLLTSDDILNIKKIPQTVGIIGSGYVALEMAEFLSNFGTKVTMILRGERILRRLLDPDISQSIESFLNRKGIKIIKEAKISNIYKDNKKMVELLINNDTQTFTFDEILIATGRKPNIDLNLKKMSIESNENGIIFDERLQTTNSDVYVAGDVTAKKMLVTVAAKQGSIAVDNALFGKNITIDYNLVPYAIYINPQIAGIGVTENDAKRMNIKYDVRTLKNSILPKANTMNMIHGLVKMIVDKEDNIIGFHGFAPFIAEYVSEASLAIKFKLKLSDIIDTIHPYPTMAESIKLLAQSFYKDVTKLSCCAE